MFSSLHDCDISLNSLNSQNSRTRSSGVSSNALHACAASPILSARCVSGACAAGCSTAAAASAPALGAVLPVVPSFAAVAAHAVGTPVHGTTGRGGRPRCSQVPRRSLCTKGGVSSLPEDEVSDSGGTGPYFRAADSVRGPIAGSSPGRRSRSLPGSQKGTGGGDTFCPPRSSEVPLRDAWSRRGNSARTWPEEGVWDRVVEDLSAKR